MLRSVRLPLLFLLVFSAFTEPFDNPVTKVFSKPVYLKKIIIDSSEICSEKPVINETQNAYDLMHLEITGLSKKVFDLAMKGYDNLLKKRLISKKNILSIIDFSKASNQKRLYVLDIKANKLLFQSLVAHGRNSGLEYPSEFSNEEESHKSSLGFYVTLGTYKGGHGYALRLKGCEKGFNDKAYERSIVMHSSQYVNEEFIHNNGYLGRSFGCPAIPEKLNKKIIDAIKKGSCLFMYHPTKKYLLTSPVLNG